MAFLQRRKSNKTEGEKKYKRNKKKKEGGTEKNKNFLKKSIFLFEAQKK